MRRLPVYFVIDVSESMVGEPIKEVEKGLNTIVRELRDDPYALETVFISVLAFAGRAEIVSSLTELVEFKAPALPTGSGTNLGAALELLMQCVVRDVQKTTPQKKGDWKPIIFLLTDGAPTDNPDAAIRKWKNDYARKCNLVIITLGNSADVALLERTGAQVLTLSDTSPAAFREFFKWVSVSLQVSSMSVSETGQDGVKLADSCINLEKADSSSAKLDENYVILSLKCSHTKKLWLAKYGNGQGGECALIGAYLVDEESYDRLGGSGRSASSIDVGKLDRIPECPSCHKSTGLAQCSCGKLFCTGAERKVVCPWCGNSGELVECASFDVGRSKG